MTVVTFMVNLLCAMVSCPPNFGLPGEDVTAMNRPRLFTRTANSLLGVRNTILPPAEVEISEGGILEGYFMKGVSGKQFYAFEGIPFAEAPIGARRFRPPVPAKPWKGKRSAKSTAPYCLQMHTFFLDRIMGVEDCLKLNVYSPSLPSEKSPQPKFPVIIYIHGGSYQFSGAMEYGPAYFLEREVVLVIINYRLGILGFLSTGDEANPGNLGLKDQALAIEWVHKNIDKFGGDPSKVTLVGESAGASSVHFHMLTKRDTRNYFHRAVAMSGSAFNSWAIQTPAMARKWAVKAARLARCPTRDGHAMIKCLRGRNPVTLVSNQFKMLDYFPNYPPVIFAPVLEPESEGAYLTETPEETYERNGTLRIPMIVSNTEGEGEVLIVGLPTFLLFAPFQRYWRRLAPVLLDYKNIPGINHNQITDAVEKFYFWNGTYDSKTLPMSGFSNMTADRFFAPGVHRALQEHSRIAPTYSSVFNFRGRFGIPTAFGVGRDRDQYRVGHTEDLFYILNMTQFSQGLKTSDPEYKIAKLMVDTFVNFAETGEPTLPQGKNLTWPRVDPENIQQLAIDKKLSIQPYPQASLDGIRFWNSLNLTQDLHPKITPPKNAT